MLDPLVISGKRHDVFPKTNLFNGYIGDHQPLCIDLPARDFLHQGATYERIDLSGAITSVPLASNSNLFKKLCNAATSGGSCRPQSNFILTSTLACTGVECSVDTLDVVTVQGTAYKYVPRRCVSLQFFNGGRKSFRWSREMCQDPRTAAAGDICCTDHWRSTNTCLYDYERVTYSTMEQRCTDRGMRVCSATQAQGSYDCPTSCCPESRLHLWSDEPCKLQAKVDSSGRIAVTLDFTEEDGEHEDLLKDDRTTWFNVEWLGNSDGIPNARTNGCGPCTVSGNSCICDVSVVERAVFSSRPSREQILSQLHVGSHAPSFYPSGTFEPAGKKRNGVRVFKKADGILFDSDTIFQVTDEFGEIVYRKNLVSVAEIDGSNSAAFRNPPSFHHIVDHSDQNKYRTLYEIDALLDHLVLHPNTAPFVAYRLIQRLVTSNPSPRYIGVVADAFRSGNYQGIGSGKYGDLGSTVAAVLLDREARSIALDADPSSGQLRESLLKLVYAMRSLQFHTVTPGHQIEFNSGLRGRIEQMIHEAPSVFSYFRPDYCPSSTRVEAMGLVGPESEILNSATVVSFWNTMRSLAKYGFTNQKKGPGEEENSVANMALQPSSSSVVDTFDLLLTNGRLSDEVRSFISSEYNNALATRGQEEATQYALQLFFTSSEFQISGAPKSLPYELPEHVAPTSIDGPLQSPKNIVFINLDGGADSFSLLVPHSECTGADLYSQYSAIRGNLALDMADLLPITDASGTQACAKFGMHPNLQTLHSLYEAGDALWFANTGTLVEPVTRDTLLSKKTPNNNFSHNVMGQWLEAVQTNVNTAVGVLGRITDALAGTGIYRTGAYSLRKGSKILENAGTSPPADYVSSYSIEVPIDRLMIEEDRVEAVVEELTRSRSSIFGDVWSSKLLQGIDRTEFLRAASEANPLQADDTQFWLEGTGIERGLQQISKLVAGRSLLGTDRNVFSVGQGGFDAHNSIAEDLDAPILEVDKALRSFVEEMKMQGTWDDTVIVIGSEFGRALVSNGQGCDHGWGGNYVIMGGAVKGGRILGQYPVDLDQETSDLLIEGGRVIPTTPWEAIWNGVAQWVGVPDDQLNAVLPHRGNFPGKLYTETDLFEA